MRKSVGGPVLSLTALCAALVIAAGCASNSAPDASQVKVEVASVGVDKQGMPFVLLEDSSGDHVLPIMIGENEAQGIAMQLHGLNPGRPLTYDLIRNLLQVTGNRVDRVEVNDLREETYYATIFLDHGRHHVDSRPSDAIAVALATNAPIYVQVRLFESGTADVKADGAVPVAAHGLGLTVQELSPDMAEYFAAKPGSGLLVADVSGTAGRAGLARGDVITRVGESQVHTLTEFKQSMARLGQGHPITLTVERDGQIRNVTLRTEAAQ
ncbi:MAG TPA: bifunctional nuclease domain-containing protein [Candidatus Binataceae bacterium]|nr:bifunctional nuclease domain-containing protein [Candidatus Binataceae bacterium]